MRTKLYTTNPDEVEFTLQVTMTLKAWKELREAIDDNWPGWDFKSKITDMLYLANKAFEPMPAPTAPPTQQGE